MWGGVTGIRLPPPKYSTAAVLHFTKKINRASLTNDAKPCPNAAPLGGMAGRGVRGIVLGRVGAHSGNSLAWCTPATMGHACSACRQGVHLGRDRTGTPARNCITETFLNFVFF